MHWQRCLAEKSEEESMNAKKTIKKFIGKSLLIPLLGLAMFVSSIIMIEYGDAMWGELLVILGGMMLFVGGAIVLGSRTAANRSIKRLRKLGLLEKAAMELENEQPRMLCKNKVALTSNFLFGKQMGAACAYNDMLWVYKHRYTSRFLFIPILVQDSLVIETGNRSININLGRKDKNNELLQIIRVIREKNPYVLAGHTEENLKAYKQLRKQKKQNERV